MQDEERDQNSPAPEMPPGSDGQGPFRSPAELGLFDRVNNYLLLVYAAACLLMYISLGGLLYFKKMIVLSLILPGILSIILPLTVLVQRSGLGFAREFSLVRPGLRAMILALIAAAAAILPADAFTGLLERVRAPEADYISFILSIKPKGPLSFALVGFGVVIVAACAEEILFRGFIQRIFQRNMNAGLAISLAAVIFALCHADPVIMPAVAALGILFGYLFSITGSLWCSIGAHAIYNLASLISVTAASAEEIASDAAVASPHWALLLASIAALVLALWLLGSLERRAPRAP